MSIVEDTIQCIIWKTF